MDIERSNFVELRWEGGGGGGGGGMIENIQQIMLSWSVYCDSTFEKRVPRLLQFGLPLLSIIYDLC